MYPHNLDDHGDLKPGSLRPSHITLTAYGDSQIRYTERALFHRKGLISTIEPSKSSLERQALKTLQPPFTIPIRFIESQVKSVKLALLK